MTSEAHRTGLGVLQRATSVVVLFQAVLVVLDVMGPGDARPGLIALLAATMVLISVNRRIAATHREHQLSGWVVGWRLGTLVLLAVLTLLVALDRYSLVPDAAPHLAAMLMWTVVALKGAAAGKLRHGGPLGLRVRWTLNSRLAWERAHRLLGRVLFAGGLLGLGVSPFVSFELSAVALVALIATAVPAALYESRRTWHSDPERAA